MYKDRKYNRMIVSLLEAIKNSEKNLSIKDVALQTGFDVKELYNIRSGGKKGTKEIYLQIAKKFPDETKSLEAMNLNQSNTNHLSTPNYTRKLEQYLETINRLTLAMDELNAVRQEMKSLRSYIDEELKSLRDEFEAWKRKDIN